jgi:hypothetical protein
MGLVSIVVLDKFYWQTGLLEEDLPDFSFGHLIRSLIIFISLSAISWSLITRYRQKPILIETITMPLERLIVAVALIVGILLLTLFITDPKVFSILSEEDGPGEYSSALLLLVSSSIFFLSFLRFRKNPNIPFIVKCTFFFFTLIFFVIAMEEISWFQRILKFHTPDLLNRNSQNEFNIHNIATSWFENSYYFGAFLFLIVLPFVWRLLYNDLHNNFTKLFVPKTAATIICALACAYNFDMWNILFTQISFFAAIIILFIFYKFTNNRNDKFIFIFTIFLIVITQAVFLFNGENFIRLWDVTEYKEFFIPLAFVGYAWGVYRNFKQVYLVK